MKQNIIYALLFTGVFCTLNACSNDLNGPVAPNSANEAVTYAYPDTEWEEYFMALDSLNQIFFPYPKPILCWQIMIRRRMITQNSTK